MAPQASLGPMAGTGRMARLLNDDKLCRYIVFDNKTAQAPNTESAVAANATTDQKKKHRQPPAGQIASLHALQIQLIAMRYPAVAARPFVYIADGGKRHVKTRGEKLIARKHIEDTLARCHRFFFVIVHFEMPFRSLHGHHILRAGVGCNHETLSPALYMERQQTKRMACGIYGGNAGHDLVARFDEG